MLTRTLAAAVALLVLPGSSGLAAGTGIVGRSGCVGGYAGFSCGEIWAPAGDPYTRVVPAPRSAEEAAQFAERDRKWVARCRPAIVQDRYGVSRYHCAAPRCEFGVIGSNP